jgi:hypothetical protein
MKDLNMAIVPVPGTLTFHEWGMSLFRVFPDNFIPTPPKDAKHWQEWSKNLLLCNPDFGAAPYPTKMKFEHEDDWKIWAGYFVGAAAFF